MIENFARTSPKDLCLLYLTHAADQAETAVGDASRWFFALPSIHVALGSALVVMLKGTAEIGVYKAKVRQQYLAWFDDPEVGPPPSPWVEETRALLRRAQDPREPDARGRPLSLTAEQIADLERLASYRNAIEHVRPGGWSLATGGLPRIMDAAAEALSQIFEHHGVWFHLEPEEEALVEASIRRLRALYARYPGVPQRSGVERES